MKRLASNELEHTEYHTTTLTSHDLTHMSRVGNQSHLVTWFLCFSGFPTLWQSWRAVHRNTWLERTALKGCKLTIATDIWHTLHLPGNFSSTLALRLTIPCFRGRSLSSQLLQSQSGPRTPKAVEFCYTRFDLILYPKTSYALVGSCWFEILRFAFRVRPSRSADLGAAVHTVILSSTCVPVFQFSSAQLCSWEFPSCHSQGDRSAHITIVYIQLLQFIHL